MNKDGSTVTLNIISEASSGNGNHKESIRKKLYEFVGDALDRETLEVTRLFTEERQKAIAELVEENKNVINSIVEEGKKLIRSKAQLPVAMDVLKAEFMDDLIKKMYCLIESDGSREAGEIPVSAKVEIKPEANEWTEVEILPPRDQEEIDSINEYLNFHPNIVSVELITMVDRSLFRIRAGKAIDFVDVLSSLPQVLEAKRIAGAEHGKIQVTLQAKLRLSKTQDDMNARVKKIFHGKK